MKRKLTRSRKTWVSAVNGHRDLLVVVGASLLSLLISLFVGWLDADRQDRRIESNERVNMEQTENISDHHFEGEAVKARVSVLEAEIHELSKRSAKAFQAAQAAEFSAKDAHVRLDGLQRKKR